MPKYEPNIEDIELYLKGELPSPEKTQFEKKVAQDLNFKTQVEEYQILFQGLEKSHQRRALMVQMEEFHQDLHPKESKLRSKKGPIQKLIQTNFKRRNYFSTLAVAASVAIISVLSTLWVVDNNTRSIEQKQKSYFLSLRRDLNKVKQKQNRIAQKQAAKLQNTEPNPVRQYGATAFVISKNGYLVTNYHVVDDADSIYIETERESGHLRFKVENIYSDAKKDLAILKIIDPDFIGFGELPYTFRTEEANLGESVFTLAYPRHEMVYGEGSVSAQSGYLGDTLTYQISIPVNPGNSGGPLLDAQGNLVGIVSGKHRTMEGAAFAVKAKHLKSDLDSLALNPEIAPVILPSQNRLQFINRPEQIKLLKDFVYVVRVYNGN